MPHELPREREKPEEKKPTLIVIEGQNEEDDTGLLPEAERYLVCLGQHMVECPHCGNLEHVREQEWPGIKVCERVSKSGIGQSNPEYLQKFRYRVKPYKKIAKDISTTIN